MKYLIFNNITAAEDFNHTLGRRHGVLGCKDRNTRCVDCRHTPLNTTYWASCKPHPTDGRVALEVDETDPHVQDQVGSLVDTLDSSWTPTTTLT